MVCLGSQRIETEELTRREKTDDCLPMMAIDIRNPHDSRQNQIDELCVLVLLENDRVFIIRLHGQVSRQVFQLTRGKQGQRFQPLESCEISVFHLRHIKSSDASLISLT